ncbi:hypothetical protein GCM10027294_25350 [Marinactinospora endophytica]
MSLFLTLLTHGAVAALAAIVTWGVMAVRRDTRLAAVERTNRALLDRLIELDPESADRLAAGVRREGRHRRG